MRIGVDGYNLAIPNGTGVATYGASLAHAMRDAGNDMVGVFGIDPGPRADMRETLFFEQFGRGHNRGNVVRRAAASVIAHHTARPLIPVPLTEYVDKRGFGTRWPDFAELWTSPLLFEAAWGRFQVMRRFTTVKMPNPPEVMHWTYPVPVRMAGSRNVYTMHDLVPLKLPHTTLDNKGYYHRLIRQLVAGADQIATVSEASRNDILAMFGADPDKVTNCYQASPLPASVIEASEADDHAMIESVFGLPPRGFYLFFGASDPKKNIGRIVDAYLASQSQRPLVVVSSRDWGMSEAGGGLGKDGMVYGRKVDRPIVQLQYLPRETLFRLIRSARAVLFPSLYEGFGLPALEAIQLGTPVISSNTSSLPEVVGEGGLLVDPYDTAAITRAVQQIDQDDALVARLSAAGLVQARKFTSDLFAQRLAAMYAGLPARGA
ncbi:glycosyltransferase family 1 protein [Novosphingobium sp. FSW06-99]|uniref:glycosyltransferase family 4 protein n=1 Tax=Novosphingobium sp. FSW06-99 TaxID=1739113 RepID=UPI00076D8A98|nr:glycosyltransferase family 1 protein [Novosphingobium sp. FSW06-99]KUR79041.1 glycosyl transferase family 1 [Novosphingobium sp. FSW06-99]